MLLPVSAFGQNTALNELPDHLKADSTISLVYYDTLSLPSFTDFDLQVKMRPAAEISAISLGFYFPKEYLEVTGMELAHGTQGYQFAVTDSTLFQMVWSSVNPIMIAENDTIITINMRSLDISTLSNTIRLDLYEFSEFADQSANVIEGVILEIPEISYKSPSHHDTISGFSVRVFPNPFDDYAKVDFTLKIESSISLSLVNQVGQKVRQWDEMIYPEGNHQVRIYAVDLSKGIYLLKFEIRNSKTSGSRMFKILNIR